MIRNHPYFKSVTIERDIDVKVAVGLAEVRLEDFKALNPQMNRPVILAAGTPQILLPWDNAAIFERNLQAHADRQLATWTAWTTPKTMKVDEAAQQVGMAANELRAVNSIPGGMLLKAGSTLLVHRKGALDNDVTGHTADNAQLSLAPEIVLRRVAISARKGDTLASLGARHGVTAASLASWNKLSASANLKSGQQLTILVPSAPARSNTRLAGKASGKEKAQAKTVKPANTIAKATASKPAKQVAQANARR
jgi:membrane-bound lytic murein transglycosylase D